jgi:unconventional prefoldin RPB5 interactor 1
MESFINLNKFNDKTKEDFINCELKIDNWIKFRNDYKALKERLSTITDRTTHEVMVPIGGSSLAFMPGFIKHTNEILVLLGDNYFVERSAKQAIDIVNRRIAKCQQMIDDLNREKSQIESWLSFSDQFSSEKTNEDLVEIIEEFDEQKEILWREQHKRNVRSYKLKLSEERKLNQQLSHSLINEKLDKLEIQELDEHKKQFKSILKKDNNKSNEKSVSFDEIEESVVIKNEEESYPLPKFDRQLIKSNKSESIQSESEVAFKNEVIERPVTERVVNESSISEAIPESSDRIVSRFKANRMKKFNKQ